ncbi:AraC family transcriptional regulator [Paenibacillus hodogayensis]|uniref:AraC family transcriptional regulator n=1 Tax=Paenibacillus hodogayensis TaxID=279208 RepID=A0ABV5VZS9_9BACL
MSMAGEARQRIEATAAYMERHLDENVTRETLAALAGMNPEHYSRLFRKYMGASPIDYLTGLRMERAKTLMRQSEAPIAVIARQVGFTDPYYFSRRFRQAVGLPPLSYRRKPQQRIVALDYYEHFRLLGIEPVGADGSMVSGSFPDWSATALDVSGFDSRPDAERIRALKPDLIVTAREELEPALAAIGKTVVLNMHKDPVYEQLRAIASLTGRNEEADRWIAAYEERAARLRQKLSAAAGHSDRSAAVLRIRGNLLQVYGTLNMGYPLYRSLLLEPPEKIRLQSLCNHYFHSSVIAPEELPYYAAHHLFVVLQPDSASRQVWDRIRTMPAWRQFPAVRNGNVYEVDVRRWLAFDPISIMRQMDEAASLLLAR